MDKKLEACVSKLRTLDRPAGLSCIYQWVLTKHIRLNEFNQLIAWIEVNRQIPEPVLVTEQEDKPEESNTGTLEINFG